MIEAGGSLGIPSDSIARNLERLVELLRPVAQRWPAERAGRTVPDTGLPPVADSLGALYGLADLLALRSPTGGVA